MRLAVTGAAGFIGSHLCDALLSGAHEVVAIDMITADYDRTVKLANVARARRRRSFSFYAEDVRSAASRDLLRGCDAVLHLAGQGGARGTDAEALRAANQETAVAVIEHAAAARLPKVLLVSSSSVYGDRPDSLEDASTPAPISPYGHSKLLTERLAAERAAALGVGLSVVRLFSVYGPRQRPDMAFARYIDAWRTRAPMPCFLGGTQRRNFTYVADAVQGLLLALGRAERGAVYDLAGAESVTLNDAFQVLAQLLGGSEVALEDCGSPVPEPLSVQPDLSRAHRELGFSPAVALTDGLRAQIRAGLRLQAQSAPVG